MASMASARLGKRLYEARANRGLTMAALANKAKVGASTINTIEKGRTSPAADTIERLAKALGVDPCWLAYGTGAQPDWTAETAKG